MATVPLKKTLSFVVILAALLQSAAFGAPLRKKLYSDDEDFQRPTGAPAAQVVQAQARAVALIDQKVQIEGVQTELPQILDVQVANANDFYISALADPGKVTIPLNEIVKVRVIFDEDVAVSEGDFIIAGSNPASSFPFSNFEDVYNPDFNQEIVTWTLANPVSSDKLLFFLKDSIQDMGNIKLDGDWIDSFPTGDGTAGGPFNFRLNVQVADLNGDGKVDLSDFGTLKANFGRAGTVQYFDGDINLDAKIDLSDFGLLKSNFGKNINTLPEPSLNIAAA